MREMSELNEIKDTTVRNWLGHFEHGTLTFDHFHEHWKSWIFKAILPPHKELYSEPIIKADVLNSVLIESLEEFIFFGNENILINSKTSPICGKVFKKGDYLFRCLDCGLDPTCALCTLCFRNSIHKSHNFKITISQNHGCCDCGDVLCWKNGSHCEEHFKGLQTFSSNLIYTQELLSRASIVVNSIFRFLKIMIDDRCDGNANGNRYCTVVYDHKSFHPEGTNSIYIQMLFGIGEKTDLSRVCQHLFQEGWFVLLYSSYKKCEQMKMKLEKQIKAFMELKVVSWSFIVSQIFATKLLSWLRKISKNSEKLLDLITVIGLNLNKDLRLDYSIQEMEVSYVEQIFLNSSHLCKALKLECYCLFILAMQAGFENKKAFATAFCRSYGKMIKHSVLDFQPFSFDTLSIQLFNDPLLIKFLIEHNDVISILLNSFYSLCLEKVNTPCNIAILESYTTVKLSSIVSLKYILSSPPREWNANLRDNFLKGINSLLKVLASEEVGILDYESEEGCLNKITNFSAYGKLASVINSILIWCSTDEVVCLSTFKLTLEKHRELCGIGMTLVKSIRIELGNCSSIFYDCHRFSRQVCGHLAISRFLADVSLILSNLGHRCSLSEISDLNPELILDMFLILRPLNIKPKRHVFYVHNMNQLNSLINQLSVIDLMTLNNRDVMLLQICASLMGENEFLLHILHKFCILDWVRNDFENDNDNAVECLMLIIIVIRKRWNPAVADVTTIECLKYEIIEALLEAPAPRCKLTTMLLEKGYNTQDINALVDKFTKKGKNVVSQQEVCVLNEELISDFVLFRDDSEKENSNQIKEWYGLFNWLPRKLPKFTGAFQSISKLLYCDAMLLLMSGILKRSQLVPSDSFSAKELLQVLYLIGLALLEDEGHVSAFIATAEKWNLKSLIEKLLDLNHLENERGSLLWVLEKYNSRVSGAPSNGTQQCAQQILSSCENFEQIDHLSNDVANFKFKSDKKKSILNNMSALQKKMLKDNSNALKLFSSDSLEEVITHKSKEPTVLCILCLKEETMSQESPLMVCPAFIQKSKVLTTNYEKTVEWTSFFGLTVPFALHINSCGHIMHKPCWEEFMEKTEKTPSLFPTSKKAFYFQALLQNGTLPESSVVNIRDYTCPVCKFLSNTVVPLGQSLVYSVTNEQTFTDWLKTTLAATASHPHNLFPECSKFCVILNSGANKDTVVGLSDSEQLAASSIKNVNNKELEYSLVGIHPHNKQSLMDTFVSTLSTESEIISTTENEFFLVWLSTSYTIRATERLLQISNKPLLGSLDFCQKSSIESLIILSSNVFITYKEKLEKLDVQNKLWSAILKLHCSNHVNIFLWDCFELLVPLVMKLSSSNISYGAIPHVVFDTNVFRVILLLNFAQTILFADMNEFIFLETNVTSDDTDCLTTIIRKFKNCGGVNTVAIWNLLKSSSLQFLKCSAIFYYFLSGLKSSKSLNEIGGDSYENILSFLGIPIGCKDIFDCPYVECIFDNWASLELVQSAKIGSKISNFSNFNVLIDLPSEYSELIYHVSNFSCPAWTNEDVRRPTICLSCGEVLCSNEHTKQCKLTDSPVGFCMHHSSVCGGRHGIFLCVKPSMIILLSSVTKQGCFLPSPYIDENGKSYHKSCKVNKLRLCPDKYKELKELMLSHNFHKEIKNKCNFNNSTSFLGAHKIFDTPQWHLM